MNLQPPELRPPGATSCLRHPGQHPTGLCAPCLRERLSLLNPSASPYTSQSSHSSKSSVALPVAVDGHNAGSSSSSSSIFRKLRRCNTFSGNKCESVVGLAYEPRRNSCDARVRSSLWALFNMEDEGRGEMTINCEEESKDSGLFLGGTCPVPVVEPKKDDGEIPDENGAEIRVSGDEIRDFEDVFVRNAHNVNADKFEAPMRNQKTIKEFIDLESKSTKPGRRDFKEIAGSFWIAASVFSRKLRKWKRKQRSGRSGGDLAAAMMGLRGGRQLRDTQSETGEYWSGGRRSCDTDPRCSIDLARASVDGGRIWADLLGRRSCDSDPRFSMDLGRASFDRESAARFSTTDPGRASFDGTAAYKDAAAAAASWCSFREAAAAATSHSRFPIINPGRGSFDGGRTSTSFREAAAAAAAAAGGHWIDPGRASYDGGRTSAARFGCALDRGGKTMSSFSRDSEVVMGDRNHRISAQNNHVDTTTTTSLLRFNLPPLKAAYKKRSTVEKTRFNRSNSMARTRTRTSLKLY
ncbi:hypothetical protein Dimus_009209 [Dionaea muscipula]